MLFYSPIVFILLRAKVIMKRLVDVLGAGFGLVLLSPLLVVVMLLVRKNLGAPIFFRQRRPGFHGNIFTLIKFRTMTEASDADGRLLPDAQRMTRFGRFLRGTSLDELPELINVFKGDMSLVGPRPLLVEYLERYSPEQARRHEVRPGITGWAQVNGRNLTDWTQRFEYDVWYVDNHNLLLDLKILLLTLLKTMTREGISGEGHATMGEFMGSAGQADEPHEDSASTD